MEKAKKGRPKVLETEKGNTYKYFMRIGEGGTAKSVAVTREGQYYVAKLPRPAKSPREMERRKADFKAETEILQSIKDKYGALKYIANLIEGGEEGNLYYTDDKGKKGEKTKNSPKPYLILDFYTKNDLDFYLSENGLPTDVGKYLFIEICKAVQEIHSKNICHLDLKPGNIMLDKEYNIKLIDFGFAKVLENENEKINRNRGTSYFKGPEIRKPAKDFDGKCADLYALGQTLLYIFVGNRNFCELGKTIYVSMEDPKNIENFWKLIAQTAAPDIYNDEGFAHFENLFFSLCSKNPKERPNFDKILNHQFLLMKDEQYQQTKSSAINYLKAKFEEKEKSKSYEKLKEYVNTNPDEMKNYLDNKMKGDEFTENIFTENDFAFENKDIDYEHALKIKGVESPMCFMNKLYAEIKQDEDLEFVEKGEGFKLYVSHKVKSDNSLLLFLNDFELAQPHVMKVKLIATSDENVYLLSAQCYAGSLPIFKENFEKLKQCLLNIGCIENE